MIILLALCTFLLSLSNLWLWMKFYKTNKNLMEVCKIMLEMNEEINKYKQI